VAILVVSQALPAATLDPDQQRRAAYLYTLFVAPCCWRQSVDVHRSEAALHVRTEIDGAVQAGRSDAEIKEALIREYGHGILMNPEGIRGFVVYTVPALALVAGLLLVIVWMKKRRYSTLVGGLPPFPMQNATGLPDVEFEEDFV
jgi:cytochrome c-type biogenesis protein CcmH